VTDALLAFNYLSPFSRDTIFQFGGSPVVMCMNKSADRSNHLPQKCISPTLQALTESFPLSVALILASEGKISNDLVSHLRTRIPDGDRPDSTRGIPAPRRDHRFREAADEKVSGPATRSTSQEHKPDLPRLKTITLNGRRLVPPPLLQPQHFKPSDRLSPGHHGPRRAEGAPAPLNHGDLEPRRRVRVYFSVQPHRRCLPNPDISSAIPSHNAQYQLGLLSE